MDFKDTYLGPVNFFCLHQIACSCAPPYKVFLANCSTRFRNLLQTRKIVDWSNATGIQTCFSFYSYKQDQQVACNIKRNFVIDITRAWIGTYATTSSHSSRHIESAASRFLSSLQMSKKYDPAISCRSMQKRRLNDFVAMFANIFSLAPSGPLRRYPSTVGKDSGEKISSSASPSISASCLGSVSKLSFSTLQRKNNNQLMSKLTVSLNTLANQGSYHCRSYTCMKQWTNHKCRTERTSVWSSYLHLEKYLLALLTWLYGIPLPFCFARQKANNIQVYITSLLEMAKRSYRHILRWI